MARSSYHSDYMMISPGTDIPSVVNMIVEIPKGRRNKFELDKETGLIRLDRYLYSSSVYPGDYGFIPQTLAADGDPLDILAMVNEPTFSGCLIEARVVGMFRMKDKGFDDFKVLCVPNADPLFGHVRKLEDVPPHFLREVEHFFGTYKQLEGALTESLGWIGADEATHEVRSSVDRFRSSMGNVKI
ncbi:inorganic diphosphatase [Zavarzinella formosa]|uniref:inorganic diphosphatase n=1 Tax=Zavarzinella formosa TaxID=360055 RepID=UPI00035FCC4F|nr:inorganic diphosphatase [Zavarzinella formosa]